MQVLFVVFLSNGVTFDSLLSRAFLSKISTVTCEQGMRSQPKNAPALPAV